MIKLHHLLQKEHDLHPPGAPVFENNPWREKVIQWWFAVVSALGKHQPVGVYHPFDRATVHVTTALMDNYLASLSCKRSARFRCDRVAYQVLATSCLLLGMRLANRHQNNETTKQLDANEPKVQCEMKRTRKHHQDMHQHGDLEIPNVRAILRISAASKSILEADVLAMVREIAMSRVFPRSHSVTALDFIQAFAARNSTGPSTSSNGSVLVLEPSQERNARLLADVGLVCSRCRPSIVACAAMTVVMLKSVPEEDKNAVRQLVFESVFGECNEARESVRDLEKRLLRAATAVPRNGRLVARQTPLAAHVIPQEE